MESKVNELSESENPYWHSVGQTHSIDLDGVRQVCLEIYNIFAASGALAGEFEFADGDGDVGYPALRALHHAYAEPRALELILRLAMLVRTYDDIMGQSEISEAYAKHVEVTSGEDYIGDLEGGTLSLREACNKIIHAQEIRPIYDDVERDGEDGSIKKIWHLRGEIELGGMLHKKKWSAVLYVPPFLEIVLDRIAFGWEGTSDESAPEREG
jgi:hypothetical protein